MPDGERRRKREIESVAAWPDTDICFGGVINKSEKGYYITIAAIVGHDGWMNGRTER